MARAHTDADSEAPALAAKKNGNNNGHAQHSKQAETTIPKKPVAIVLAGAGARGAYEAGFIATLLPRLRPRPTIFVGTSAGAINAALLAATADQPPEKAAAMIMESWGKLHTARVFRPLWKSVPLVAARYLFAIAFGSEAPRSLADTTPLIDAINDPELLDWNQLHKNIEAGLVDALAVVATETGSGRSKVFFKTRPGYERVRHANGHAEAQAEHSDDTQAIDYVKTPALAADHVRASAAIPVLFPPVALEQDGKKRYFIDGGVRLNAPLKPALHLGAEGLVVVSTDPRHFGTSRAIEPRPPTLQGQVLQLLRAVFADRMVEDIRVLLSRNRKAASKPADEAAACRREDRVIPIVFGGPQDQDRLGGVAARAVVEILHGVPLLRLFKNIDIALLNKLTSVSPWSGPDLLSYILFEPAFLQAAMRAGIQDASALLNDYPNPDELWNALAARDQRHQRNHQEGAALAPTSGAPAAV